MTTPYHISNTPDFFFGCGSIRHLHQWTTRYNGPVLIITGGSTLENIPFLSEFLEALKTASQFAGLVRIAHEPSPNDIDDAVRIYQEKAIGCVVSIGGGSVMDAGKAISAMLPSEGSVRDFLEGIGNRIPTGRKVPFIAAPTTAGTGSEATLNAVISEAGPNGFKKSLRHSHYVPDMAVVDPELTITCSPEITAASGMDAFTQLVESYLSTRANPFTDALALDAIGRLYGALELAFKDGWNVSARSQMAYAAYISGITLANAGLGVVHGFAQPLGSLFGIPHGVACGTLMAAANNVTVRKITSLCLVNSPAFDKYGNMGRLFAGFPKKSDAYCVDFCISELERLTTELKLPLLADFGVEEKHFDKIVALTGLKYHPVQLTKEDLVEILELRLKRKRG